MANKIVALYNQELEYWTKANQKFLGVSPIDETWTFEKIQKQLDKDAKRFWNSKKPCKLAKALNDGTLNHEIDKQTENSYVLKLNFYNMCIDIYGDYDGKLLKIGAIPTPSVDLSWIINYTHYVPRVVAMKDYYGIVRKTDFENVIGEGWSYNIKDDEFVCNIKNPSYIFSPTIEEIMDNHISIRSKALLEAALGEKINKKNFTRALRKLPQFSSDSLFNYKFARMEYFEDIVLHSNKYAQPTKKILLGVNTIIASKTKQYTTSGEKLEGYLVASKTKIFALENFRTCANIYNASKPSKTTYSGGRRVKNNVTTSFQPAFTYSDTNGFFDSFKTVTSKSAGRQRLLLDNVVVKDGMLWIVDKDGKEHNMFEYLDMPQSTRLSCLSQSPFCNNDKSKRIMMNAKMTSQAVSLKDEIDEITHRITARVGFTDIEGFTTADSIIISKSFAEKLRTFESEILYLNQASNLFKLLTDSETVFDVLTLKQIFPIRNEAILDNYENFKVDRVDIVDVNNARVFLSWEIPFGLGDKITNLHGAKGTVGRIYPDEEMPRLTKKVGNMEPGPLDIVFSGFSTIRRGSLGQIFEAWALASGIELEDGEDFISKVIEKYKKQMEVFSKNSVVEYKGITNTIPVGINYVMRLYHHASTHVSCSSVENAYRKTLRFGEMEKLNLVANDCPNILKELGIRSLTKYVGSHRLVNEMQETRELPTKARLNLQFIEILKSMGYELDVNYKKGHLERLSRVMDDVDINGFNDLFKGDNDESNN